jgi:four helix bundle protein
MDSRFENLEVWKKAHQFTLIVYKLTRKFPPEEKYSLCDQLKRSAASVPTNIVEGNERNSKKEFIQFLYTSKGSLAESKYHILLSKDLGYINEEEYLQLIELANEIGKMLNGLISYLRSKI